MVIQSPRICCVISIHAPLAGRDRCCWMLRCLRSYFNPRAPCGARRPKWTRRESQKIFQSTRPLRGATAASDTPCRPPAHFNPRAPCGARHAYADDLRQHRVISIHAPLAGRDGQAARTVGRSQAFQSTRPLRGATMPSTVRKHFRDKFQSTRPLRGATIILLADLQTPEISIHAPLAGRDLILITEPALHGIFQSTRPLRGATANLTNSYPQICAKVTKGTC